MAHIIMFGNLNEGYRPIGPFDDFDHACAWCETVGISGAESWIMEMESPQKMQNARTRIQERGKQNAVNKSSRKP